MGIIDITLAAVFVGALATLWVKVSEKLPVLATVPDHVIVGELERHARRIRLLALPIKTFYQEKRYRDLFFNAIGKVVYRLHILVMRMDNSLVLVLKFIQRYAKNGYLVNGNGNGEYWKKLHSDESVAPDASQSSIVSEAFPSAASSRPLIPQRGSTRAKRMIEIRTPRLFE